MTGLPLSQTPAEAKTDAATHGMGVLELFSQKGGSISSWNEWNWRFLGITKITKTIEKEVQKNIHLLFFDYIRCCFDVFAVECLKKKYTLTSHFNTYTLLVLGWTVFCI